jgi:MFS transporter, DHA3 family, macrolide efflux protein
MKSNNLYSKFLLIWFGQFISVIGTGLSLFALGVYVYQQTNSATNYVFVLMCVFLPPFLLKPYGGVLADRYDRRLMMILGDLGATIGLLYIFFFMWKGNIQIWQIYLGISVSSVFSAFQEPAYKALVTDLLPKEQYAKASGLMQLATSSQYLISPFLAGLLLMLIKIEYIFLIDTSTLIISSAIVIWIRKVLGKAATTTKKQNFISEFKEGFRAFTENKGVVNLVLTIMMVLFFVGLLQSLLIPMLLNIAVTRDVGIAQSVSASGMILGSLFIGLFGSKSNYRMMLSLSLFLAGLFFANMGLSTSIIYIASAGFLFFATLPFINTSIEVMIRNNIDNSKQGRVWSIISMVTYFGSILAFAVAGFLADKIFNPLLEINGLLADSVGKFVGVGSARGIALMLVISGAMISVIALILFKNKSITLLENPSQ